MEIEANINALNAKEKHLASLIEKKKEELKYIPESRKKLKDLIRERDSFTRLLARDSRLLRTG